tara:strand:+ start:6031 stop:6408 length:378 start_codon:yes stop_codon:yes gene_type:complete
MIGAHLGLFAELFRMKKTVIIQFEVNGFHNYPAAPTEVEFLKFRHRHSFKIKCGYKVSHEDREKEIFICRDEVKKFLFNKYGNPCEFENMSCEMIAKKILEQFKKENMFWCEVWEEQTGGAKVEL